MSGQALFYGRRDSGELLRAERGFQDDAVPVLVRILPPSAAPAGTSGEASFGPLWLTLVWTAAASVSVTPVLDDVELVDETVIFALAAQTPPREETFKIAFARSVMEGLAEVARQAVRGNRCTVLIELEQESEGIVLVAGLNLGIQRHTDQLNVLNEVV